MEGLRAGHPQAEESRHREDRYQLLVQNIHEYIYSVTFTEGRFRSTYHSARSYEITGYTPEEYAADPDLWFTMIHVDDRQRVNDFLNAVTSGGTPVSIEHRIIHKDRSIRWVANTAAVEHDERGRISSLNGYVLDVTDRKNAEARQKIAIQILEMLNRSGTEKEVITQILFIIKQFLGIEAAGIRLRDGDDFPYFAAFGFPERFVEEENSLLAEGTPCGREPLECLCGAVLAGGPLPDSPYRTPHGSLWMNNATDFLACAAPTSLLCNIRGRCFRDGYQSIALIPFKSDERTIGLIQFNDHRRGMFTIDAIKFFEGIGASIGISHSRKMAEEALRESNERYRTLFENSFAVMLLIDPRDGGIVSANKAACDYYGYDMADLTAMRIDQIQTDDPLETYREMLDPQATRRSHFTFQHRLAGGRTRDVEVYVTPQDIGGRTLLHSIIHDITERMRAERSLRESEEELRRRNESFEKEIELAQLVQKRFIPARVESTDRIRIDFRYYPHDAIGGDYFAFVPLPMDTMGVFIGDVVGHGIAASLFLSLLKAATDRVSRHYGLNPRLYLQMLNAELIDYLDFNFITAIYGLVRYTDGSPTPDFAFSNGGHPKPVLYRRATGTAELLQASGKILGVFPELNCEINTTRLESGDRIFLYTDGIPEARNDQGHIIGFDDMPDLVMRASTDDLGGTLDAIINEVYRFNGGRKIDDDLVLIGIEIP